MTAGGAPGPGWWRSAGRWYPPEQLPHGWSVGPDGVPRSVEYPPTAPVHPPLPVSSRWAPAYDRWPGWAKLALPVVVIVVAGGSIAVALRDDDLHTDLAARPSTEIPGAHAPTTTRGSASPSVTVAGLVVTPPTLRATTQPSTTSAPTTSRGVLGAPSPSGGNTVTTIALTPSTTSPPAVGATTTSTTTTIPPPVSATTATTSTSSSTRPSTSTTTRTTTTRPATTTTRTTTTRPATTTTSPSSTRATTTTTRTGATHTITGTLLVDDRTAVSDDCGGTGRFAEFHDGQAIVLLDASARIVGQGVLANCRWTDWRLTGRRLTAKPEFTFTISGVPETSSYTPRVGSTSWPSVTLTSIRDAGFRLVLVVD